MGRGVLSFVPLTSLIREGKRGFGRVRDRVRTAGIKVVELGSMCRQCSSRFETFLKILNSVLLFQNFSTCVFII